MKTFFGMLQSARKRRAERDTEIVFDGKNHGIDSPRLVKFEACDDGVFACNIEKSAAMLSYDEARELAEWLINMTTVVEPTEHTRNADKNETANC